MISCILWPFYQKFCPVYCGACTMSIFWPRYHKWCHVYFGPCTLNDVLFIIAVYCGLWPEMKYCIMTTVPNWCPVYYGECTLSYVLYIVASDLKWCPVYMVYGKYTKIIFCNYALCSINDVLMLWPMYCKWCLYYDNCTINDVLYTLVNTLNDVMYIKAIVCWTIHSLMQPSEMMKIIL